MLSIRATSFPARLKRLSVTAFGDLIESMWQARGYSVDREGTVLVVADDADERTLWLHHTTRRSRRHPTPPERPIDIVVTNGTDPPTRLPPGSPRVIDATDLEGMLFYAIDRETAATIADRVFDGTSLEALRTSTRHHPRSGPAGTTKAVLLTLVLVVGLITTMAVLPGTLSGGVSIDAIARAAQGAATERTPADRGVTESPPTTPKSTDTGPATPIRDLVHAAYFLEYGDPSADVSMPDTGFPTGLAAAGIEDADRIAESHARHIDNRSYRVEIEYQEFDNGEVQSTYVERIAVESPTRYVSTIEESGNRTFDPPVIAETAVFADGQTVTPRDGENYSVPTAPSTPIGPYTNRLATYIHWYLSVEESAIVDLDYAGNRTHYIVALGRDPWPGRVNSSGVARIDDQGVVHYLRVKYRIPNTETIAEITIRYVAFGDVEVSPPRWYPNATRMTSTPTPATG